jgi:hypothetical protein
MKREIEIDNWNAGKGMTKAKSEEMRQLNTYLEQVRGQLVECYQELKLKNKLITAEAMKELFLRKWRKRAYPFKPHRLP